MIGWICQTDIECIMTGCEKWLLLTDRNALITIFNLQERNPGIVCNGGQHRPVCGQGGVWIGLDEFFDGTTDEIYVCLAPFGQMLFVDLEYGDRGNNTE